MFMKSLVRKLVAVALLSVGVGLTAMPRGTAANPTPSEALYDVVQEGENVRVSLYRGYIEAGEEFSWSLVRSSDETGTKVLFGTSEPSTPLAASTPLISGRATCS